MSFSDDANGDWEEDDFEPDESDFDPGDSDEDEPTIACPYCRRQIHEDSLQCPYCEHYLSDEDAPAERKPWWIVVGVAICLYIVYRWTVG